ncbi:hypothetical protein PybrP1_011064 [[Pythium] brassicae (nom. inval.)]|nr:hypothetical protein PybrP1_011064 [[Pythium] brassicae (nom. inval.)]
MASTSSMKRQLDGSEGGDLYAKRARASQTPTRVVFVRGLPADCLESELLALCYPFAAVEKSVLVPHKCQAFVQLADAAAAATLISFYQSRDALIRGKQIFFEHADRDEITQQQQQPPPEQYALRGLPPAAGGYRSEPSPAHFHDGHASMFRRGGGGQPNTILMVAVTKIEYDVTVDVLQQVFQKFGNVNKIVTFWKNDEFKALVEMESIPQAQAAQAALDGREIYTGCNQLGIVFSRHTELRVRFNNDRSRDYTNPHLPPGPPGENLAGAAGTPAPGGAGGFDHHDEPRATSRGPADGLPPPRGGMDRGDRDFGRQQHGGPGGRDSFDSREPSRQQQGGGGSGGYERENQYRPDERYDNRGPPPARFDQRDQRDQREERDQQREFERVPASIAGPLPSHSTGRSLRTESSLSSVLICSNMDRELVNPVRLFAFFGCFGDVLRVKIMFRKQDTALIQFYDDVHATSALDHLDGVVVFGKKLRVDYSKHTTVSMPRGEVDRFELDNTRDFTNSPLHRFRRRSPQDAVPPGPLLHVSGIPQELQRSQSALVDLFAQYGFVKNFHYIQKNTKMALVEMGSLDEAIMALVCVDNLTYPDSHLRVSFSRALPFAGAGGGADLALGLDGPPAPMHAPQERTRDRSRERPGGGGGMRHDRYDRMDRYGGGGGDNRDRGLPRDNRGRSGDQFPRRGPPPQRY